MRVRRLVFAGLIAVAAGCAGAPAPPLPAGPGPEAAASRELAAAARKPTPSPTPTRTPPHLSAQQIDAALDSAETYYATLPHEESLADLEAVAKHVVATKAFASATVSPGGISATLPDGSQALIVADRPEDRGLGFTAANPVALGAVGPATAHEIAFLINEADLRGAFVPFKQRAFGEAFRKLGFPQAGYGIDVVDVTLDNILALGKGHPLDVFDLATHGIVGLPGPYYANLSTTPISDATKAQYAADIAKGTLKYAIELAVANKHADLPSFAFTPQFLTDHLTFNPGAIFDNQSCFGQSPLVANAVAATLRAAGIGRYIGWTKAVSEADADQSDAFLLDRMLGEQSPSVTGLNAFAAQRTPAQRPFPLDAIENVMRTEIRKGPYDCGENVPYAIGLCRRDAYNTNWPPLHDGAFTRLLFSDFGGENVPNPPIEYALPSIEYMTVDEGLNLFDPITQPPGRPVLTIYGYFPKTQGSVKIAKDVASVQSWSPCTTCATPGMTQIKVPLNDAGPLSSGAVQAFSSSGIASNAVPLTQWTVSGTATDSETIANFGGHQGSGSGHVSATFDFNVRTDVEPAVDQIDTDPVPPVLSFDGAIDGLTVQLSAVGGSFAWVDGNGKSQHVTFSEGKPSACTSSNCLAFFVRRDGQAKKQGCYVTGPGVQPAGKICAGFAIENLELQASDGEKGQWTFDYLADVTVPRNEIDLTLDPKTYALTAKIANPAVFASAFGFFDTGNDEGASQVTDRLALHFGPPLSPP